jgi:hypothetical protein
VLTALAKRLRWHATLIVTLINTLTTHATAAIIPISAIGAVAGAGDRDASSTTVLVVAVWALIAGSFLGLVVG